MAAIRTALPGSLVTPVPMFRILLVGVIVAASVVIAFLLDRQFAYAGFAFACMVLGVGLGIGLAPLLTQARRVGNVAAHELAACRDEEAARRRDHDALLSLLGHELRNPLGAITAAVEVLQRVEGGSALARRSLGVLVRQSANLARSMNEFLDAARVMGGTVALLEEPVDLAGVAERALATIRVARADGARELVADLSTAWIRADALRVEQIVAHLLARALRVTPDGDKVELSVRRESEWAVLRVRDHGPGIDAELLARVFEIQSHGRHASDRGASGSSIGLALVRRLTVLHGGRVSASSSSDGSAFETWLPAIEQPQPDSRPAASILARAAHTYSFVIVDATGDADALGTRLAQQGHDVHRATDGPQGLALIAAQHPDVAIVGLDAGGIDGIDFARRARAAGFPGLMVAAFERGRATDLRQILHAGFDASLDKPIDADRLRELMSAHL